MNKIAFNPEQNKNSKTTKMIMSIPANTGLCRKCSAMMEWRKNYRKYKPIKEPVKCAWCLQKTVKFAYHTVCLPCAKNKGEHGVCAKCLEPRRDGDQADVALSLVQLTALLQQSMLKERQKRSILRAFEKKTCSNSDLLLMIKGERPPTKSESKEPEEDGEDEGDNEGDEDADGEMGD